MNDHAFIVQKLLTNFEGQVAHMTIKDSTNLKQNSSPQHIVFRADRAPLPYHFMLDLSLSTMYYSHVWQYNISNHRSARIEALMRYSFFES